MKIFNDPIHGRIEIPEYCVEIIDTIEFQRLRYLKQLGLVSYVFYGATHTRFEHSIGVSWIAGEWIKHLSRKQPELGITLEDIKTVQIAGLVHDLGHGPFSHTFENFIKKSRPDINYNHEQMSINIFKQMKLSIDLETIDSVCKIISGTRLEKPFLGDTVHNVANGLDSDKLDYFIRDSQCTSFKIGCDWKRLVYESSVLDGKIVYPEKLVGDVFNLYQTRFRLYKELYFHKTVTTIEEIFLNSLIIADSENVFKFIDSSGSVVSLSHCIDDVKSFIQANDDIMGQMERCEIDIVKQEIVKIKTRNFGTVNKTTKVAHYGKGEVNPMCFVNFVDKNGTLVKISEEIVQSMCPYSFSLKIE